MTSALSILILRGVWVAGGMGGSGHGRGSDVSRNGRVRTLLYCEHVGMCAGLTDWCLFDWIRYHSGEHRNQGGQILFIEFCDWAVKQKQLKSQDDGCTAGAMQDVGGSGAAGHGAGPSATRSAALAKGKGGGSIASSSDFRCGGAERLGRGSQGLRVSCCWMGTRSEFPFCCGREWAGKLPIGKSESDQTRRAELFQQFDPNGNGYLSLAEVDKGVREILGLEVRGWALLACFGGMQATEEGCDGPGPVQMQACDHEGVSSCERDPHGDRMRGYFGSREKSL